MPQHLFDITPLQPLIDRGYVLLTPNQRLARRIRREWDARQEQQGRKVWETLRVYPLEAWLRDCWQKSVAAGALRSRLVLSKAQESLLWQSVIAEQEETSEGVGLIHPAAAAEQACGARDLLLRWRIPLDDDAVLQCFDAESDCRTFADWLRAFNAALARSGWATPADCLQELAAASQVQGTHKVVLIACDDLSPLDNACLELHCAEVQRLAPPAQQGRALAHPFADQRQELSAVAAWAARLYREQPTTSVGIVLADTGEQRVALDYLLRREFDCFGGDYYSLPVNFSTGIGLSRAPVVRDALLVLATLQEDISVAEVVALLHSRYLKLPDAGTSLVSAFIRELYRRGSEQVSTASLRNLANTMQHEEQAGLAIGEYLLTVSGWRELRRTAEPSVWLGHFTKVLELWGWPGTGALDSLEYQQVDLWYQTLEDFRSLDTVCGVIDCAEALRLLRLSCDRQVSHPQTGESLLQVLGPLEAVGLSFDHLWVCGVQGGSWPSPPRPNPFVPHSIQAAANFPHATPEREWQFSETLLRQYRSACSVLHASYSRQINGASELPSGLIADFEECDESFGELLDPHWMESRRDAKVDWLVEDMAPAPSDSELAAMRGGSALIEHQSQCPFRAFAEHRLGAKSLADFVLGVSSLERGTVVHEALQYLWTKIDSHAALLSLESSARETLVRTAAETGVASLQQYRKAALGQACLELEQARLETLLEEWLSVEEQRGKFTVRAVEQPVHLSLARLEVKLKVDRIDELPEGGTVIIDYKTGAAAVKDWLGERPAKPQLLLYGLAAENPPAALSFGQVRPGECAYVGIGDVDGIPGVTSNIEKLKTEHPVDDWEALNAVWRDTIERLAQAFVDGNARVDPLPKSCDFCGLQQICRVDDVAPTVETVGGEGVQ